MEGATAGWWIVGICFHSNEHESGSNPLHTEYHRFLSNAYGNVSVHTATNLQRTVTAKNSITTDEGGDLNMVQPKPKSETEDKQKSEVFILYGVATVTFRVLLLFVVMKCYS
jgi:hypothetical protein